METLQAYAGVVLSQLNVLNPILVFIGVPQTLAFQIGLCIVLILIAFVAWRLMRRARNSGKVGTRGAFLSRAIVLQAIGGAFIAGAWIAGLAHKPFDGDNAPICAVIVAMGVLGIICVFKQRWDDVKWLAAHIVRVGLLGTVVGLIIAFAGASGGSANPEDIKPMIAAVISGMYVSLYATLLGIGTNLWLKVNLRLLGNFHG